MLRSGYRQLVGHTYRRTKTRRTGEDTEDDFLWQAVHVVRRAFGSLTYVPSSASGVALECHSITWSCSLDMAGRGLLVVSTLSASRGKGKVAREAR